MKRTIIALLTLAAAAAQGQVRVKDIATLQGARSNQLVGYGIVVGLEGSGDSSSAPFTAQSMASAMQRQGIAIPAGAMKLKNCAAVYVTADLPAFVRNGSQIDVTISSIGDAKSLQGGVLIRTPMSGPDGEVYAVAQGAVSIGGFNYSAGGSQSQKNHTNVGRIPRGGIVEKEVATSITDGQTLDITLKEPDFTTAARVAEAVNAKIKDAHAVAQDPYTIRVTVPVASRSNIATFWAGIEPLVITPDNRARIVVNERTGTVVIGGDVKISSCAIAQGAIQVKVENTPIVAIPAPFSENGTPVIVPQKSVTTTEKAAKLGAVTANSTIEDLVKALNALGVSPRDMISILQTMRAGGHIMADIEVQ